MTIQVKKWRNPTKQSEIRYYISGLKGVDAKRNPAIEVATNGKLNIFSRFGKDPGITLQDVLQQLFDSGLISTPELDDITIETLDRLSGVTKANANNHASLNRAIQIEPIALEKPVTIIIDHREPEEIFNAVGAIKGVQVEKQVLPVGDFVFQDCIVERKTANDLSQSVIDKCLFFQSDAMAATERQILRAVIIEGNPYGPGRLSINAVDGAISYLAVLQGLTVLSSVSPQHTANLVARMASHAIHGLDYQISYREAKPKKIDDQIVFLLQGLPGIGIETAKALLRHFGSLSSVFNATPTELCAVDGIGKKTAESIVQILNKKWLGEKS